MEEREIVTIGFGNYATLVAAQWANSTSQYDVYHKSLYRERDSSHVLGGGTGKVVRVPRLLLLDAAPVSDFRELPEVETEMEAWKRRQSGGTGERDDDDDDDDDNDNDGVARPPRHVDPASSVLWQTSNDDAPSFLTADERHLQRLAEFASRRWGQPHRRRSEADEADENEEHEDDNEDEDDNDEGEFFFQLPRRRNGIEVDTMYPTAAASEERGKAEQKQQQQQQPTTGEEEAVVSKESYKKVLFRRKGGAVPWWRYITTGMDVDGIVTMRPSQHVDAGGELPTLHNVGYGLSSFKVGNRSAGSADEAEALANAVRRQLEDADSVQGLQCFIDGDSMFAGAAYTTLMEFWEDVDARVPATAFTVFAPLPAVLTDLEAAKSVPFAERRRDEACLNRLLCTSLLSQPRSALYIPIEVADWPRLFAPPSSPSCWWVEDDTATAQFIAAIADSALYGTRDGGGESGPAFYMTEWVRTLRPTPSTRVSALLGSLPLPVPDAATGGKRQRGAPGTDLWNFLARTPLLPNAAVNRDGGEDRREPPHDRGFVALTHAFPLSPETEAGRVVGHTVSLRGAGALPSAVYPAKEAMLRYALPLRTATYLPLLTSTNMPVSTTFPLPLLFDSPQAMRSLEAQCNAVGVSPRAAFAKHGLNVGAHAVTSYQSAPMLGSIVSKAQAVLRYKEHLYNAPYGMETDDWRERLEDVSEMFDDYRHGSYSDGDGDGDGGSGGDDW